MNQLYYIRPWRERWLNIEHDVLSGHLASMGWVGVACRDIKTASFGCTHFPFCCLWIIAGRLIQTGPTLLLVNYQYLKGYHNANKFFVLCLIWPLMLMLKLQSAILIIWYRQKIFALSHVPVGSRHFRQPSASTPHCLVVGRWATSACLSWRLWANCQAWMPAAAHVRLVTHICDITKPPDVIL